VLLLVKLSVTKVICHKAQECLGYFMMILSVIIVNVIPLCGIMLNAAMQSVAMLNVNMLTIARLNATIL
jgi:hypothetical protein